MTTSDRRLLVWIAAASSAAIVLALGLPFLFGPDKGVALGLMATGRLAFVLFFLAYVGGPLTNLFGEIFAPLRKRARDFGLTFAAVIGVHLGLVASLCVMGNTPARPVFVIFGPAAVCAAFLTLVSFAPVRRLAPQRVLAPLMTLATTYIMFAFLDDFVRFSPSDSLQRLMAYAPFAALGILGLLLKLAAFIKSLVGPAFGRRAALQTDPAQGRS